MAADRQADRAGPWEVAAGELSALLGDDPFELRYGRDGGAAVRVGAPRGAVARCHAEAPDVRAPWSARASSGEAAGWPLAPRAPADPDRARALLQHATDRHTALTLQRLARQQAALTADLLEVLTHHLRTDVSSLQGVAEGALAGVFEPGEADDVAGEVRALGTESQRRLSDAREVMGAQAPGARLRSEPLVETVREALEPVGLGGALAASVAGAAPGEQAMVRVPGPGWTACARLLAEALATDPRLGGRRAQVSFSTHPDGWLIIAGDPGTVETTVPWTQHHLGRLVHAGQLVSVAGGWVHAARGGDHALRVAWTVPATASGSFGHVQ